MHAYHAINGKSSEEEQSEEGPSCMGSVVFIRKQRFPGLIEYGACLVTYWFVFKLSALRSLPLKVAPVKSIVEFGATESSVASAVVKLDTIFSFHH